MNEIFKTSCALDFACHRGALWHMKFYVRGREEDTILPWNGICRMGEDIVLVDGLGDLRRE